MLLGRKPVQGGERVVHADEAEVAIPEADPDRGRAKHGVELGIGLLGGLEEERVVDRERGAPGDLVRELEVGRAEPAARLTRPKGDRAEQAPACLERDDDVRNRAEGLVEREVLLVDRGAGQRGVAGVLDEVRLAAPHDLAHRVGLVRLGRVTAPELAQQLRALVVAVGDHYLPQGGVLVERIDDAVVGDPRDEQPRQIGQGRLVVQRRGEQRARLGEKVEPSFGVALLGDVSEDVDHELDAAVGRQDRRRTDDRPALVTARKQAVAEHGLLGRAADESAPVGQFVGLKRPAVFAENLEAFDELRSGEGEHLLSRLETAQPSSGVIRVHHPAVRALRRDPVPDVAEDRGELDRGGDDLARAHAVDRGLLAVCRVLWSHGTRTQESSPGRHCVLQVCTDTKRRVASARSDAASGVSESQAWPYAA